MTESTQPEPAEGQVPAGDFQPVPQEEPTHADESGKTDEEVAKEVLAGHWGRGKDRDDRLRKAGYEPSKVRKDVLKLIGGS